MTYGNVLELAADVLPARNWNRSSGQDRGNHARLDRFAVDLLADKFRKDVGTLRVADQDVAPSFVVVLQIVVPRVAHVVVVQSVVDRYAAGGAREQRSQSRERYLPV